MNALRGMNRFIMAKNLQNAVESTLLLEQIQLCPLGEAALVLHADETEQPRLLAMQAVALLCPEILTTILGVGNLTFRFDPVKTDGHQLAIKLKTLYLSSDKIPQHKPRLHELPVHYGGSAGPDLAAVAAHTGLSCLEVIERHCAPIYDVLCIGFLPGFPYLAGLDNQLACPRRASPRLHVPAGSVGIGGRQTGIYPRSSPGGWQLIGQCSLQLFDENQTSPSLLLAGDQVKFVAVSIQV